MPTWQRIRDPEVGFAYDLSEAIAIIDWSNPSILHCVQNDFMIIASDYSGQHKAATHEAHTFLITTSSELIRWLPSLKHFREKWLPDGRKLSFKDLREPVRWRALQPFLETASLIKGNVITFLVDRRIETFVAGGATILPNLFPNCFSEEMKPGTMEKMLRLATFVAMLTTGFRKEGQKSFWVSDHDETLDSFERRDQLGRLACYLIYGFARWQNPADMNYGTTKSSYSPEWAEHAVSISDIIAGTCCNLSSLLPTFCGTQTWTRTLTSSDVEDRRAHAVGNWMATTHGPLRPILVRLELDGSGDVRASAQYFSGSRPTPGKLII